MTTYLVIFGIIVCIYLSNFFSGSEMAFSSCNELRLENDRDEGDKKAGLALFIAGFPVLFWNEGDSVKTAKAIDEGEGACIAVESNANVDQEMEGKMTGCGV